MARVIAMLGMMAALAACGVDGEPVRPSVDAGISAGKGGVFTSVGVGLSKGPVSVRVGL